MTALEAAAIEYVQLRTDYLALHNRAEIRPRLDAAWELLAHESAVMLETLERAAP